MKRIGSIVFLAALALCWVLCGCESRSGLLECNTGTADITPAGEVSLAGFAARKGLSDGVHRPLRTHCLVLQKDTTRVCIITNDMMELSIDFAGQLRREISERTGIPYGHIFIHNTHTHSAPRTTGATTDPGGPNEAYKQQLAETMVANAAATAADSKGFRPFTIEAGKGQSDINCNRRESDGPIDHDLYAVRFIDKKGKPIVSLVNFACHPVSLDYRSRIISPDFPGIATEELHEAWGGPVFYFAGAAGNVDPCGPLQADTAYTNRRGRELAQTAMKIEFRRLPQKNVLAVSGKEVHLPYSISEITPEAVNAHADEIRKQTSVSATWPVDVDAWRVQILDKIAAGGVKNYLPVEIAAVDAGGLMMLFSQGEPFNEYQAVARESVPDKPLLFVAYTNGQNSYLPSSHAYASAGYIYEKEQMHVYIKAPWPLSDTAPQVYEAAIKEILGNTQ